MRTKALAAFAEAGAGRHRDLGLFDQELGEFDTAELAERLGDRRPGEHRGPGRRNFPTGAAEAFDQHVAAAPLYVSRILASTAVIRAVQCAAVAATCTGVNAP